MSDLPPETVDTSASDAAPVSLEPDAMTTAAVVEQAPTVAAFSDHDVDVLTTLGRTARENNDGGSYTDGEGRMWSVLPSVTPDSQSVILVTLHQGAASWSRTISTATYSPDALMEAVKSLVGA